MVLDYKDISFSFKNRKTRRRRQRLKLALLVIALLAVFCGYRFYKLSSAIGKIQDLLLDNQVNAAKEKLANLAFPFFQRGNIRELGALTELFGDRLPQAEAQFDKLRLDRTATSLRSGQFLKCFIDRGEYAKLKIYSDYLLPRGGDENIWYYALVQAAFFNHGESEHALARLSPAYKKANAKALAFLFQVNANLRLGRFDYIFDRNNSVVAYFDVRKQRTQSLLPGLDFSDFDRQIKKGASYFRLTLDAKLQIEIDRLFTGFFGTLLILDLPQNSILAAYSRPRSPGALNAVFSEAYEPGSIIKIVSLLAYLRHTDPHVFPYVCSGQIALGGHILYDLLAHKKVNDYGSALAMSCNPSFARMGLAAGFQRLSHVLECFYFNARPFTDWFLKFQTGTFNRESRSDFELAKLATGLGNASLTTVHAAVLAAVFAQNGLYFPPYMIDDAKSILDLGFYSHGARPLRVLADELNFNRVKKAMQEVVNSENGTGRRAWSAEVNLAIKTGTAGNSKQGLDVMVMGFFPAEKPRYAFAFRLEGAGKAEFNGAFFLQRLLKALLPR